MPLVDERARAGIDTINGALARFWMLEAEGHTASGIPASLLMRHHWISRIAKSDLRVVVRQAADADKLLQAFLLLQGQLFPCCYCICKTRRATAGRGLTAEQCSACFWRFFESAICVPNWQPLFGTVLEGAILEKNFVLRRRRLGDQVARFITDIPDSEYSIAWAERCMRSACRHRSQWAKVSAEGHKVMRREVLKATNHKPESVLLLWMGR